MKLIGQDCACVFFDGGAQSVNGPNYGSGISVKAVAKSIKASESSETVSTRGLGDSNERLRHKFAKESVDVELLIDQSGPVPAVKGHYGKFVITLITGLAPITYEGLVTKSDIDIPDDAQTQSITLECGAD